MIAETLVVGNISELTPTPALMTSPRTHTDPDLEEDIVVVGWTEAFADRGGTQRHRAIAWIG